MNILENNRTELDLNSLELAAFDHQMKDFFNLN